MSGIDRSRVVGKDEDELDEFICGICQHILDEPVLAQCCSQLFCHKCIDQEHRFVVNSPINPYPILARKSPAPLMVINLLNKLKIKCENYGNDCQTVLTIKEMANHMKTCNTCDSCKTSKKLLTDKQNEIQSLKSENEELKNELDQLKGINLLFKETVVNLF